jgi:hypothetical protein
MPFGRFAGDSGSRGFQDAYLHRRHRNNGQPCECQPDRGRPSPSACWSRGPRRAANGGYADAIAPGEFVQRSALGAASGGLLLLRRTERVRGSAHLLPLRLGAASAFGGARADKIALYVRQSAQDGNHQSPGAGAAIDEIVVLPVRHGAKSCLVNMQRAVAKPALEDGGWASGVRLLDATAELRAS